MAQVKIYNQETNSYYTINFDIKQSVLDDTTTGDNDCYILVSTNIPTVTGGRYPTFRVRTMADVAPGKGVATDFNQLCRDYIDYFTTESELTQSSSSSSSSLSSSSSSVDSSSSSVDSSSSSSGV